MAQNIDFKKLDKTLRESTEGLKDQVSYMKELGDLKNRYNRELAKGEKLEERVKDTLEDVVDKTKDIFKNRKALHEEQLTTVDLHKLERRLIAEGLEDQVKFVQKLKEEDRIQKQINRTINSQAKLYNNIGSSIDSMVRSIPGGGFLGDLLGLDSLGKEMSESFRTQMASGGGFFKGAGQEFAGGVGRDLFVGESGTPESKKAAKTFFRTGLTGALGTTIVFAAATKLFSIGMSQGFQSQGVGQAIKRMFAGGAFEGIRAAFGTGAKAERGSLFKMIMNKRRFGVSEADQAKILSAQTNIAGLSQKSALSIQSSLASSAAMRGVLPADVFQDIANNTEQFSTYTRDGGQNIGEAAIRARELGVSLDTVFKVSDSILDFQSSIENELKASLLIGRQLNLNEARRLAMAGDMAGLQEEILRQVGSEEELQRMNAIQRKSLAGALGVTVQELNKLASGDLEVRNSDMKQNTTAMQTLTFVTGGLAAVMAARLAGPILGYGAQMFTTGGFKKTMNMKDYTGRVTSKGLPDMRTTAGKTFMANQTTRGLATGVGRFGTMLARGAAGLTPQGIALTAIITGVMAIVKNTKDTAESTKRNVSNKNFTTSTVFEPAKG